MKLRIRGDSLRLRLTKDEVKKIGTGAAIHETTHFFQGAILEYILEPAEVHEVQAEFIGHQIFVRIPRQQSLNWAQSDAVAIKHESSTSNSLNPKLSVLIEKDFACLKTRVNENEDESDKFENPNAASGSCS